MHDLNFPCGLQLSVDIDYCVLRNLMYLGSIALCFCKNKVFPLVRPKPPLKTKHLFYHQVL